MWTRPGWKANIEDVGVSSVFGLRKQFWKSSFRSSPFLHTNGVSRMLGLIWSSGKSAQPLKSVKTKILVMTLVSSYRQLWITRHLFENLIILVPLIKFDGWTRLERLPGCTSETTYLDEKSIWKDTIKLALCKIS